MAIRFSPEMTRVFQQMTDTQQKLTVTRMADDFSRAYVLVGNLIGVRAINIEFNEKGLLDGTESDMDFAISVCYEMLRVQRAICADFGVPDHDMLEVEKKEQGF